MTLAATEPQLGAIAYFSIDDLRGDQAIRRTGGSNDTKARPFACYAVGADGQTFWTPLTTDGSQPGRTQLDPKWIRRAVGRLASDPVFVNDGGHTYVGPPASFVQHSAANDNFTAAKRPRLSSDGVAAVLAAVKARGGQLP